MSSASSTRIFLTFWPCGPVCCVTSCIPRILRARASASSGLFASLTPPPLPRPPAWICALTTARPPNSLAIRPASSGESVTWPRGVATPNPRRISLAWYSCIFMATGKGIRRKTARSMMKLPHLLVFALAVPGPLAALAVVKAPSGDVEVAPLPADAAASLVREIVAELKAEDLVALQSRFDEPLKAALPDEKLRGFWAGVGAKGGRLKSCAEPRINWVGEYTLAFANCTFEKQGAELKLTFRSDGRLAGMFLEAGGA